MIWSSMPGVFDVRVKEAMVGIGSTCALIRMFVGKQILRLLVRCQYQTSLETSASWLSFTMHHKSELKLDGPLWQNRISELRRGVSFMG